MKYLSGFIRLSFFLCIAGYMYVNFHYMETLPQKPDERGGRVIAENIHGTVVYCSPGELALSNGFFVGMFVIGLIGVVVERNRRRADDLKASLHRDGDQF